MRYLPPGCLACTRPGRRDADVLGRDHALSGLAAGTAAGLYLTRPAPAGTLVLAGLAAGFATLPDLDSTGACAARSLGPLSETFAWCVRKVSGGHRHGTHSLAGAAVFTGLTWLAWVFRATVPGRVALALIVALAVAAGLRALRLGGHVGDAAAAAGAGWLAWLGWPLAVVPFACAIGVVTHLAGDCLTTEGCPLWLPLSGVHAWLLPRSLRFETGHAAERWLVSPALLALLGCLAWRGLSAPGIL